MSILDLGSPEVERRRAELRAEAMSQVHFESATGTSISNVLKTSISNVLKDVQFESEAQRSVLVKAIQNILTRTGAETIQSVRRTNDTTFEVTIELDG